MTKPTKWHVHPAKTQISLGICPVWSVSSLSALWVAKNLIFLHAQADLNLRWAHMSVCWFCHEMAKINSMQSICLSTKKSETRYVIRCTRESRKFPIHSLQLIYKINFLEHFTRDTCTLKVFINPVGYGSHISYKHFRIWLYLIAQYNFWRSEKPWSLLFLVFFTFNRFFNPNIVLLKHNAKAKKKYMCVSGFPTLPRFMPQP